MRQPCRASWSISLARSSASGPVSSWLSSHRPRNRRIVRRPFGAPPPDRGQDGLDRLLGGVIGELHVLGRDALLGQQLGDLIRRVLVCDGRGDLPQDEITDRAAVVLARLRLRPGDHPAACPVLPLNRQREIADRLQVRVRVGVGQIRPVRVWLHPEGEQPAVGADVQLLDEAAHPVHRI